MVLAFLVPCVIMLPKQSVVYDLLCVCTIQLGPNAGLQTLPELSLLAIPFFLRNWDCISYIEGKVYIATFAKALSVKKKITQ